MPSLESDTVKLKREVVPDICKEVIAFANTKGGTIYIGIADDGEIIGVHDADAVMLQVNNMVRDAIKPDVTMFVSYAVEDMDGRQIIRIGVQRGTNRPYYLGSKGLKPSGVYVRHGTSTDPATDSAIRQMIKESDGDSYESMRSLEQELTFTCAEKEFARHGLELGHAQMKTLGMLTQENIFTNAAYLLSDQCTVSIKLATFAGSGRLEFQDRRECSGSLFAQLEKAYAYIDMHNKNHSSFQGLYRIDTRDYPEDALREALLNCCVHRDYAFSASTLVSIFEDRMEFVSVGGLVDGIELEDVLLGLSVCRNPKLAAIFYRLDLIEAYGTGLRKIMHAYDKSERKPQFQVTGNAFKIILPNTSSNAMAVDTVCENSAGASTLYSATDMPEAVVMSMLEARGTIVRSEVERQLGISQASAIRLLKYMSEKGMIKRVGSGKSTRYIK